ncbi:cupin domain-containing protein [Microbacterium sp. ANT_H45B]|uniref:cupin domain-containing protein n=1 Tax=Microbacterium sp. ANT_H45B TaxID=2597346 RepID=UPI0011EC5C23|nr:cupin domain-containing protein [Microbacterium sp. ANT_H45B]KAA0962487.1 cupin domain-containing protein [Microbacterium sp. ANT_H45B]
MTGGPQIRRVVTGHDDDGRAIILLDDIAPHTFRSDSIPGLGATVPWWTGPEAIDLVSDADAAPAPGVVPSFASPGGTILRIADFPPDSSYPPDAGATIFAEIDDHGGHEGGERVQSARHFWFHRSESLDYAVVLEGEITLLVDEGEATLGPGDVVVQRATNHSWSNRTDANVRMLFVLIGTPPISPDRIAQARRESAVGVETLA